MAINVYNDNNMPFTSSKDHNTKTFKTLFGVRERGVVQFYILLFIIFYVSESPDVKYWLPETNILCRLHNESINR